MKKIRQKLGLTHGGARVGSGRPNKYGEPTVKKNYRIPISKVLEFEALLESYKIKPGK